MARDIRLKLLAEVNDAIKNLKRIEKELGGVRKEGRSITKIFKNVKATIGGFIGALALREAAQFSQEMVALNDKSNDLRRSLDILTKKEGLETIELMADLREATGNTVDDIQLMQSATRGKFLGVDLKNLPTLFEFARQRAKDTGEEVSHLVESIVIGIGRKSPLILDNLGLTMGQLREETKQVAIENGTWKGKMDEATFSANLQAAAVRVAQKALADGGPVLRGATDDYKELQAELTNTGIRIGEVLSGASASAVRFTSILNNSFNDFLDFLGVGGASRIRVLASDFKRLEKETTDQEEAVGKLLSRYDELTAQESLTIAEQTELNEVIRQLGEIIPSAVTQVDSYGVALGVNRSVIDRSIQSQRELLKLTEQDVYGNIKASIAGSADRLIELNALLDRNNNALDELSEKDAAAIFSAESFGAGVSKVETVGDKISLLESQNSKAKASAAELSGELNHLALALSNFINLADATPERLSKELKISVAAAADLIKRFQDQQAAAEAAAEAERKAQAEKIKRDQEQLRRQLAADKAKRDADRVIEDALKRQIKLEEKLQEIRLKNALLNVESDLQAELLQLEQRKEAEERNLAELLGIEAAGQLNRGELRRQINEKDGQTLLLQDKNFELERREVLGKLAEASAKKIAELRRESALLALKDEHDRALLALQQRFEAEKAAVQQQVAELNAIKAQAEADGDEKLAGQAATNLQTSQQELLALEENYLKKRDEINRQFNEEQAGALKKNVAEAGQVFKNAFLDFTDSIIDSASRGSEAWKAFFSSMKWQAAQFLASQAVKGFLKFLGSTFGFAIGGPAGAAAGGGVTDLLTGAQTGEYIPGSPDGQVRQVGEKNTDEVIIPVSRIVDFIAGRYRLGGKTAINQIPGGRKISAAFAGRRSPMSVPTRQDTVGAPGGRVFSGLSVPQFLLPQSGRSVQRTRVIEREVPIVGEIQLKTVHPEISEVIDYQIKINRQINRPDNRYVDEFLQTKNGEFD